MEINLNNWKIYNDYFIFMLGIKHLPSYYDNISQGYLWESPIFKDKNNISNCPKLEILYLNHNIFIASFEEFISGKTERRNNTGSKIIIEGIHEINGWINNLWRIKDKNRFLNL